MTDADAEMRMQPLSPHLVCDGAAAAIEFYKRAFDAREMVRLPGPDGKLMHACVSINGASVMLCDEYPDMGNVAPTSLKGTPVTIHLMVADADAFVATAAAAGARVLMPVALQFWGDLYGLIEDPFGHRWSIATPSGDAMTEAELAAAAKRAMADACAQ
jgi:PhnB protein